MATICSDPLMDSRIGVATATTSGRPLTGLWYADET